MSLGPDPTGASPWDGRVSVRGRSGPVGAWPEWLTPDWSNMHTAIENAIKAGTYSTYASADAAGMDWTADGMLSVQASNVLSQLKRDGWTPPATIPSCVPLPDPERDWFGVEEEPEYCEVCGGSFGTPCHPQPVGDPLPVSSDA